MITENLSSLKHDKVDIFLPQANRMPILSGALISSDTGRDSSFL